MSLYKPLVTILSKVKGVSSLSLPTPKPGGYIGTTSIIVGGGRNVKGKMIGQPIRYDVAKVECEWNYLDAETWSNILKRFSQKHGGSYFNDIEFYDQVRNAWITREMYVSGDITTAGILKMDSSGKPQGWRNPRIAFIEG
jgi:hypothetical protein